MFETQYLKIRSYWGEWNKCAVSILAKLLAYRCFFLLCVSLYLSLFSLVSDQPITIATIHAPPTEIIHLSSSWLYRFLHCGSKARTSSLRRKPTHYKHKHTLTIY